MKRLPKRFISAIKLLSEQQKEEVILKVCRMFPDAFDFVEYEYTQTYDWFVECQKDLEEIMHFTPKRRYVQVDIADALAQGLKRIAQFKKATRSVRLEIALLIFLLKITFRDYSHNLGTRYTSYDNKMAKLTQKVITLIKKYRPEKTWGTYAPDIDSFIDVLKTEVPHLRSVMNLPESFLGDDEL